MPDALFQANPEPPIKPIEQLALIRRVKFALEFAADRDISVVGRKAKLESELQSPL
jgi:hypothetical protein